MVDSSGTVPDAGEAFGAVASEARFGILESPRTETRGSEAPVPFATLHECTDIELLDGLSKVCIRAFGRVELDNGGTTVFHDISHIC